jgi:hypothetical protein
MIANDFGHVINVADRSKRRNISQVFTFRELAVATKKFNPHCLVGEGGFGRVYKGYIESIDQVRQVF